MLSVVEVKGRHSGGPLGAEIPRTAGRGGCAADATRNRDEKFLRPGIAAPRTITTQSPRHSHKPKHKYS
jgi:hypothetical protein